MAFAAATSQFSSARKDAIRNRSKLVEAAGEVMRSQPSQATMPLIAKKAGLHTATAYRYFPTLEDLLNYYLFDVLTRLREYSLASQMKGLELYSDVLDEWLRLIRVYGRTMIQLRPRDGLLARLVATEPTISASREAWDRPIRAILAAEDVSSEYVVPAFFLHNMMFDAREVLDLMDLGLSDDDLKACLVGGFRGAVRGWAASGVVLPNAEHQRK